MKNISRLLFIIIFLLSLNKAEAQNEYVQEGQYGFTLGVAHYFGDLNNRAAFNRPKPAIGGFFRKQFGNYTGLRVSAHYLQLGYSDIYSKNDFQKQRNLSFNTNVFEIALQGDFNFFKYNPNDPDHSFTPYVTLGAGVFSFDPYAYYQGEKVFLRPLNTEGESFYMNRKAYSTMAICFPIGIGFKYSINPNLNFSFEITHRFTRTDYLDDVSTTYIGIDKFPSPNGIPSLASILQDRSFETGEPIGIEGRQRGFSKQKDQYLIAEVGLSFNLSSYKCPPARK
ncbi:MAG: porin family protein [Bacteroidota bacterium]|nr:porin family protein [Bacteroidota bacterium]